MYVIKMVKSIDEIIENSKNANDIMPNVLKSLLFSIKVYDENKYEDKELNEYSMLFRLNDKKIMNISLGKYIIKDVKNHNIQAMLVYSTDLMNAEVKEPLVSTYLNGIINLDKEETVFDVFDKIYLVFKENEDYKKFETHILKGE